jgi:hypothetical protein
MHPIDPTTLAGLAAERYGQRPNPRPTRRLRPNFSARR